MPTYTYNNGNFTSTTNVVNGVSYTQNINMLNSTGSGCGDNTCSQGYSIYVPCVRNITRGENVCLEFYVVDNENRDTVDLRNVDDMTLSMSGRYGCQYGNFRYPDSIHSLQSIKYKSVMNEEFKERNVFDLNVVSVDDSFETISESNLRGCYGRFYENESVILEAGNTYSYIFLGWIDLDEEYDDDCPNNFISRNHTLKVEMSCSKNIAAVYRPRKKFKFTNVTNGVASFKYLGDDGTDKDVNGEMEILEGHSYVVKAVPNLVYVFKEWGDGNKNIVRCYENINRDIKLFINTTSATSISDSNEKNYKSYSISKMISENIVSISQSKDYGKSNLIYHDVDNIYDTKEDVDISSLFVESELVSHKNLTCVYEGRNCLLKCGCETGDGSIVLRNPGVENKTIVEISCIPIDETACSILVRLDDNEEQVQELLPNEGHQILRFVFDNTTFNKISIETFGGLDITDYVSGSCLIDSIQIFDEEVVDKGKAEICLKKEQTASLHRGDITVTGGISIDGVGYGLPCAKIAFVSSNTEINIKEI